MGKLDDLTLGEVRQLTKMLQGNPENGFWEIGKNYFIRTVTHHYTGTLVALDERELVLKDAAWIADDGRLADALKKEEFNEVEPYPNRPVLIGRGAILDAVEIKRIPQSQK